jgi:hypothetical protein
VALIDVPSYVLADEEPPADRGAGMRRFHHQSWQIADPIEFPRDLFAQALAEHARMIEAHAAEILAAPLDHPNEQPDQRFVELEDLGFCTTLLASEGDGHRVYRWRTASMSYVVQRCRGIVRQLIEKPPVGQTYLIVVARGVASLHLARWIQPRRAGEGPGLEVVTRNMVVEPWDQWHRRAKGWITTWWRTPVGDLVASRVKALPRARHAGEVVDRLMNVRGPSIHRHVVDDLREDPKLRPLVILDTSLGGDEIIVLGNRYIPRWINPFPEIVEGVRAANPGFYPVILYCYSWASLVWRPLDPGIDVAVPARLVVKRTPQASDRPDDEDEDEAEEAAEVRKPAAKVALSASERMEAKCDDFPAVDPWMARPAEVHALWRAGLWLVSYLVVDVLLIALIVVMISDDRPVPGYLTALGIVAVVVCGLSTLFSWGNLRHKRRNVDPKQRQRRWVAWKQLQDENAAKATPRKPRAPRREGRKQWMRRLSERLARLERLVSLDAPETIVDMERKLVRDAIAELQPSDARAVLAAWPRGARLFEERSVTEESTTKVTAKVEEFLKARKVGRDKPN